MFTYLLWGAMVFDNDFDDDGLYLFFIFLATFFTPFTLVLDLILSPIELITLIIWKIIKRKEK